ncbi:MAG: hypothetical protein ABIA97_06725 [Candidatus Omnitrophota bacterium]
MMGKLMLSLIFLGLVVSFGYCEESKQTNQLILKANAPGGETELLFRVKVSSLGLQVSSQFVKDKKPDDVIEISLPGRLYEPNIQIKEISKDAINRNTPEDAELSIYSANKKGDAQWILDSWAQEDQKNIQDLLNDFLSKNTDIFQSMDRSYITGRAEYKNYILLFIQNLFKDGRKSPVIHTYIKTTGGWKATNALSADETFDVIFAALRSGQVILKK